MDPNMDKLAKWDQLLSEQTELFRQIKLENEQLRAKQKTYETDLKVWRGAVEQAEEKVATMLKSMNELQREVNVVKDSPLVLCLIDGDGNIFTQDLLKLGRAGGRQAALLLTKGVNDHLSTIQDPVAGRVQLWLTVYLNKRGLSDTLSVAGFCTPEEFDDFVIGFNQASPLFSIVDVGNGKEAADAKIKESLRVFTRFPQVAKIFFGGAHDNGYTTTLTQLQTEGLLSKIILLRGYAEIARELQNLDLPVADIDNVFMKHKITTHPFGLKKGATTHSTPNIKGTADFDRFRTTSQAGSVGIGSPIKANKGLNAADIYNKGQKRLDPRVPMSKHNPPPCNFYYLSKCAAGMSCRYGHDYDLNQEQLQELSVNSRKTPCPAVNKDKICHAGDRCIHGHVCPKGPKCSFFLKGKCKFTGKDMHGVDATPKFSSPAKKKARRVPSSSSSVVNGSGLSATLRLDRSSPSVVDSSPDSESDILPPETGAWDGGVVNDISPPQSPGMPAYSTGPPLSNNLFMLGQSWMYPNFGPSFTSHQ